jgi:predicted nuclease with TOPRIM domain
MDDVRRRLDTTERNQSDLAKTMTEVINELHMLKSPIDELRLDRAARLERDKNQLERFMRIEHQLEKGFERVQEDIDARWRTLQKPLWAAASAFIVVIVAALWQFIIRGGLNVSP